MKTLTGSRITLQVAESFTIADVKAAVEVHEHIPARNQKLVSNNNPERSAEIRLPKNELAPSLDYDFTNVLDDGARVHSGKFEYR